MDRKDDTVHFVRAMEEMLSVSARTIRQEVSRELWRNGPCWRVQIFNRIETKSDIQPKSDAMTAKIVGELLPALPYQGACSRVMAWC